MKLKSILLGVTILAIAATDLPAQTLQTICSFNDTNGATPLAALTMGNDGSFYGTTWQGGILNVGCSSCGSGGYIGDGTVFRVTKNGTLTTLFPFTYPNGVFPEASLTLGSDGNFYGTTSQGGGLNDGTIFQVMANGTFTKLADTGIGIGIVWEYFARASLTFGSDGNLYGTTYAGGSFGYGTVFKVTTNGALTTLVSFNRTNGSVPLASLTLGGDGNFYGTTYGGGNTSLNYGNGWGTVFKVTTNGALTTLVSFSNTNGANPQTALTLGSDGNFYGTTYEGGNTNLNNGNGWGTVFKVTTNGALTTLASFSNTNGANPQAALTLGNDNIFYSTTAYGGLANSTYPNGMGTVFKVTTNGVLTTLVLFNGTNGYEPYAGLTLGDDGNLYGTTVYGGLTNSTYPNGMGTIFRLNLVPSAPIIATQPQSQTFQAGSNVSFVVTASGYPSPNYQWQFNGQNIFNATNATLILNSVTASNDGGYSVVVWNTYGFATSTTASLAVLTDGANGNTPVQLTPTSVPSKSSGATKLVLVTHGWEPGLTEPASPQWVSDMCNDIQANVSSDWQVVPYFWVDSAWTLEPQKALNNAQIIGAQLGQQIAGMGFQQVHLIAHSAGSGLIQAIADQLKSSPNPPQVQLTFLDPYLGIFLQEQNNYGNNADWSDCYFVEDGTGGFTGSYLNHAFNVDVSWVDPAHTAAPYIGLGGGEVALSSHGYPIDFYLGSITGGNSSCSSAYGFSLSQEMEGVFWFNNQANYPVGTGRFLPCSPPDAIKNPNPGIAGLESGIAGIPTDISAAAHAVGDATKSIINGAGFELNSIWSSLPLVKTGGVQPADNTANTPAWLAVGVSVTNTINFVQFDSAFTDTNSAQGLLTVYWNTNQIGMVDERVAATNSQTYRFELPGTVSGGLYTLSFRLDSFNNSSSIAVTNVATGFVGVAQPITLAISITNGTPLLQLTAATNFTYLIQSSTNLVDWTPTALLLNTNGTAQFTDSAVTNSSARYYRATLP